MSLDPRGTGVSGLASSLTGLSPLRLNQGSGEEGAADLSWNQNDKNAGISLSNGAHTATAASGSGYRGVRGVTGFTSGTHHLIFAVGTNSANYAFGVANIDAPLNAYAGSDNNSIGYYRTGGVYRGGAQVTSGGQYGTGDGDLAPEMEVDLDARTIRFRDNSAASWTSAIDTSALGVGALYLFWATDTTNDAITSPAAEE